jgi:tRNA(Ile)-lysidine synthase
MSIARAAALPLTFAHVESILALAAPGTPRGTESSLPLGWRAVREEGQIQILSPDLRQQEHLSTTYEYRLPIPGRVEIPEAGSMFLPSTFETILVTASALTPGYNPEHLYARHALTKELLVRNWKPGDRFWPAHSKSPKKVKELLQERKVPQPERTRWPVIVSGNEIVWLRGFPAPMHLRPAPGENEAILIREVRNQGEDS